MKENYRFRRVKGMEDLFPSTTRSLQAIESLAREHFARYGCGEVRTPIVEHTELFERGVGEGTDIVNKEMFYLLDKGNEKAGPDALTGMVLRPEATASVARAYIENEIDKVSPGIQRYYYIGPMFRYERPQKGRLRQFSQIGVELLGSEAPAMDAEAIIMLHDYLSGLEINDLTLRLNSVGCTRCRPEYSAKLKQYAKDHLPGLCEDCRTRVEKNPLRLFDCKQAECKNVMAGAPNIQDHLCDACEDHQSQVGRLLTDAAVRTEIDHRLMRGLDYYSRTVFELISFSDRLGAQNAVAAGGRYDDLYSDLLGPRTPAVGWSIGVERLVKLMPSNDDVPGVDIFVVDGGPEKGRTFQEVVTLRRKGLRVRLDHEDRSAKALMKVADRTGARYALFVDPDRPDHVKLRNMGTSDQVTVRWQDIPMKVLLEPRSEPRP